MYTLLLTVPGVVHCAVCSELGNAVLTAAPKRTVLMHIPNNEAIVLGRIRIGWVEVLIGDSCPVHAAVAGTVDDACVNFAEAGLDVVVESRADVDASRPHLNVTDDIVRVARCADVEANEVVEFETLSRMRVSGVRRGQIRLAMYLEPSVRPRAIFYLDPREVHCANVGGSTVREDIVGRELAHIRVRRGTRCCGLLHKKESSPRGTGMNQFAAGVHFCSDGTEWGCGLSSKLDDTVPVSPMN